MSKRQKRRNEKSDARQAAERCYPKIGKVNPLIACADRDHASGWPPDFSDLADRIAFEIDGGPNGHLLDSERRLLARNAPSGTFTRSDGTSAWQHYIDPQTLPMAA